MQRDVNAGTDGQEAVADLEAGRDGSEAARASVAQAIHPASEPPVEGLTDQDATRTEPAFHSGIEWYPNPNRERRERIATAVLAGISASVRHATNPTADVAAMVAVKWADALIAELDK